MIFLKGDRQGEPPNPVPEKDPFPLFSSFKHHWYTRLNVRFGENVKCECGECRGLLNLSASLEAMGDTETKNYVLNLRRKHVERAAFKQHVVKSLAATAESGWANSRFSKSQAQDMDLVEKTLPDSPFKDSESTNISVKTCNCKVNFSPFDIPNLRLIALQTFCVEHHVKTRKALRYL